MLNLSYKKAAIKSLKKMPIGPRGQLIASLREIARDPQSFRGDWKPLKGEPYWRLRVGGWRAICSIENKELVLIVLKVGSRGDIYK